MTPFINFLNYIWPYVAVALPPSTAAAVLNRYILETKHDFLKWLVASILLAAPIIVHAFLNLHTTNAKIVAAQLALVAFFATPFYLGGLKPFLKKIDAYIDKKEADKTKLVAYEEMVKSAAEPIVPPTV